MLNGNLSNYEFSFEGFETLQFEIKIFSIE